MSVWTRYTPKTADDFLQERLTSSSVVVSQIHNIMKGRLVAGFEKWEREYPNSDLRLISAARTYEKQAELRRRFGSPRAADPDYPRGRDFEDVDVVGSLHQVQGRPDQLQRGWAVDFERPSVGWSPVWKIFEKKGIVFVLRSLGGAANEPWHATVRGMNGWYPGPFPEVPGIWRRLYLNDIGEDVKGLQKQLGKLTVDGHYGKKTVRRAQAVQAKMGRKQDGDWGSKDQRAWEVFNVPEPPKIVIPDHVAVEAVVAAAKQDVQIILNEVDRTQVLSRANLLDGRLDQINRIVSD